MFNQFLAVSTLVLGIVYFTLVGATAKSPIPRDKLSPERRAKLTSELQRHNLRPKNLAQGNCFDIKTDPLSPIDQLVLQIPKQNQQKDFEVFVTAFRGDNKIWVNNFKCKKSDESPALCVGSEGAGNFKLKWTDENTELSIRTLAFGNFDSPGPILAPKDSLTALEMTGDAISCGYDGRLALEKKAPPAI